MANLKISQLPSQNDILQVNGLAGYDGSGTIRISGTDLRDTLLSPISGNLQIRPQAGTLVLGLQGQGIDINGNTQINGSLSLNVDSNTYGAIGTSSFTSVSFDGTAASTSTGYAVRLSGPVADSSNAVGTSGQVLSSTGIGTQWINAGGSTPDIQTVVNAGANSVINDQGGNRSFIDFREGNTTAQFNVGKDPGGIFGIKVGQSNFTLQGAPFSAIYLNAGTNPQRRLGLTDTTSGNALAELGFQMDMKFSSSSALKCGPTALPGTAGQVLTSTGTSVEWTTPISGAFSPIDVASSETAPTAATTQYYYQTIAGATMTISKAKLWGFQGTNTVLFGIYRGTFGSLTLIGQGSATCSTGPNVINLVAESGQSLSVTAGEDIVVGFYPTGTSWRTIYDDGISDIAFGISNTANITSMPASPTGGASGVRFACTLY